jgi:competence ComEA-like helix-hairpin-helix protein
MLRHQVHAGLLACLILFGTGVNLFAGQDTRSTASSPAPLNLNAATAADLEKLPGIGAAMAARILDYRQKSGGFKKIEDILEMSGSGAYLLGCLNCLRRSLVSVSR